MVPRLVFMVHLWQHCLLDSVALSADGVNGLSVCLRVEEVKG
jgi:hypothetical protein